MYNISDKLVVRGVDSLSDCELLALLLGLGDEGESLTLAQNILDSMGGSLARVAAEPLPRLRMVEGVGIKRAQRLVVAAEWGRRCVSAASSEQLTITNSGDVVAMFRPRLESLNHEECWVLYLNASNRVIEQGRISQGGVTATIVDHRLIVKRALELLATHIVVVHNHPSGVVDPSAEDVVLTKKIKSAAALFDIRLLDHVIIGLGGEYSFLSTGML